MTVTADRSTASGAADRRPGLVALARSEWTKLVSLRSTRWSAVLLVTVVLAFTVLSAAVTVAQWDKIDPSQQRQIVADPTATILASGFQLGQVVICVLGALAITAEYSTGTIRATFLAVPRRLPVLVAKSLVLAGSVFVLGVVLAFPAFFIGAAILHSKAPVSIGDPGVLRAVVGAGLYLAVLALFSLALAAIIRSTAGAITAIVGFVLVLAPLTQLIPGRVGDRINAYLPTEAGRLVAAARPVRDALLGPWQGFAVFCGWTAALLVVAALQLLRRDA